VLYMGSEIELLIRGIHEAIKYLAKNDCALAFE